MKKQAKANNLNDDALNVEGEKSNAVDKEQEIIMNMIKLQEVNVALKNLLDSINDTLITDKTKKKTKS